jgi:citrate lyase beta subunit
VDSPTFDLRDSDLVRADAEKAYKLGFSGKAVIHPDQLSVINSSFSPSVELIQWARNVLSALNTSSGSIDTVDGQMVGPPFATKAREILTGASLRPGVPARVGESAL